MKNTIILYFLFLVLTGCRTNPKDINCNPFSVTIDTINIHLRDSMGPAVRVDLTHAVKYKDHYYTLFHIEELYTHSIEEIRFFIISEEGNIRSVPFPKGKSGYYFDLFVKNDSIIFKDYIAPGTSCFDLENLQWISISEADDVVYEDDLYYITSRNFGEWGYLTWFRNKITGQEYELGAFATLVNKVDSSYYITDTYRILQVDDPTQLVPTTPERSYKFIKNKGRLLNSYTQLQGAEIIYKDTTYSYDEWDWDPEAEDPEVTIVTSFVHDNSLFHLCQDSLSMYVARLDSGRLIPMQYVDEPHAVFNWHNSYRMSIQNDGSQLLKFQTYDPNLFGLIGICGNEIDIRYLRHDIDSIPYLDTEAFPDIFDYLNNHPDSLPLNALYRIEEKNGATDLQSSEHWGLSESYYPNRQGYDIKQCKQFLRTENEKISCVSEYYYTIEDSIVRAASLIWTETKPYNKNRWYYYRYDDITRKQFFQDKVNELTRYLTANLGLSPKIKKEKRYHTFYTLSWKSDNGLMVDLRYSDDFISGREIFLVMYY